MKIRVLKELPWAKEGEEFELGGCNYWEIKLREETYRSPIIIYRELISWEKLGWIEFVKEGEEKDPIILALEMHMGLVKALLENYTRKGGRSE